MFLVTFCILMLFTQTKTYTAEVNLKLGKIIGARAETITSGKLYYAFYGVPYARRPVGDLRFKDPKPLRKWKKPFDATTEYHGACAQSHIVHKHGLYGFEDCLHLNIYTPIVPKNENITLKSVAVWIHGYAFTSSMSHIFGGDAFIDQDIVFITVTHRIGVFGFLRVDDNSSDGNMGLKDIVLALKWIRANIKRFGGDKKKITVMGNDSGATFLSLILMTKNKNLFSKMILQSGSIFSPSLFLGDYKLERERLRHNLRKRGYRDLLAAPTKDIIEASKKIYSNKEVINLQRPLVPFSPIIEVVSNKSLLHITPDHYFENIESELKSKRILIGFNSKESISEIIPFLHNTLYLKYFQPYFKFMVPFSNGCAYNCTTKTYKEVAQQIKRYYFKNYITEKSAQLFLRYTSDLKIFPIWKFIKQYSRINSSNLFVYKFNYVGGYNAAKATSLAGSNIKVSGASNGDEICYILKCEPLWEKYVETNNDPNDRDRSFMKEITTLWGNFIRTGDPTPNAQSGHVAWSPLTLKESKILLIDNVTTLVNSNIEDETFSFWNDIYAKYYANDRCSHSDHDEL